MPVGKAHFLLEAKYSRMKSANKRSGVVEILGARRAVHDSPLWIIESQLQAQEDFKPSHVKPHTTQVKLKRTVAMASTLL